MLEIIDREGVLRLVNLQWVQTILPAADGVSTAIYFYDGGTQVFKTSFEDVRLALATSTVRA